MHTSRWALELDMAILDHELISLKIIYFTFKKRIITKWYGNDPFKSDNTFYHSTIFLYISIISLTNSVIVSVLINWSSACIKSKENSTLSPAASF